MQGVTATADGPDTADARLLRELYDEHAVALWGFVTGLLHGDRARAQDIVQETFLRAWRRPEVLDPARGSPRGWLFTVARRIVIDEWRSAERRPELVTAEPPDRPIEDRAQQVVDRRLIADALRTLSPEHREVLIECYFRGSSVAEAAQRLAIPAGTVKSRVHYALLQLRSALVDLGANR